MLRKKLETKMKSNCETETSIKNSDSSSGDDEFDTREFSQASGEGGSQNSYIIFSRPGASDGLWLCCLVPLAYATRYLHSPPCTPSAAVHKQLCIAATGMCVESLCFFIYMFMETGIFFKLVISLVPGMITSALYAMLLQKSWLFAILCGYTVTLIYQNIYIRVMRGLPCCFTFGEASLLVQGLMLFAMNAVYQLYSILMEGPVTIGEFAQLNAIMICALFYLLVVCCVIALFPVLQQKIPFYMLMIILILAVTCVPVTQPMPIVTLYNFIIEKQKRIYMIGFYLVLVALTVCTVSCQLRNSERASTRVRKIFHLLIVFVYVPGLLFQCTFIYIASGVALAIMSVLELFRILEMPPLADNLKSAFNLFRDEKDAGILALTPFCLLVGCSMPIWLSPCPCSTTGDALLPLLAGILSVGFGDTAASVIGSKLGRNKWRNSSRSLEGTGAFIVMVLLTVLALNLAGYLPMTQSKWFVTIVATLNTALVEAHTDQIDNLVLPLVFYILVSLA